MNPVERACRVNGWMDSAELLWLYEQATKVSTIAELGSWKGRSTVVLAAGCKGAVYAVDTWHGSSEHDSPIYVADPVLAFAEFKRNVKDFPNVVPVMALSTEAAAFMPDVDMVFIDADHSYKAVLADIKAWLPKAKRLICGHDYTMPSVKQAVDEMWPERAGWFGNIWWIWKEN